MKRKRSARLLPIGSVSEGTHNVVELTREFLSAAETINLTREERFAVQMMQRRFDGTPHLLIDDDYNNLTLILEDHCPDYTRFGVNTNDGADFGVWVDWDEVEYAIVCDDISKGDTLPSSLKVNNKPAPRYHLLVNDHGNATLYRRAGRRWVEIWAVV